MEDESRWSWAGCNSNTIKIQLKTFTLDSRTNSEVVFIQVPLVKVMSIVTVQKLITGSLLYKDFAATGFMIIMLYVICQFNTVQSV